MKSFIPSQMAFFNVLLLSTLVVVVFMASKPSTNVGVIDHHKVGDVVYSILTPEQFSQVHGTGWVLMDGRAIDQQVDLRRLFNWTNVPDARGVFIRGMNLGRPKDSGDVGSDAQNNRAIASYQGDVFKSHFHHLSNADIGNQRNGDVFASALGQWGTTPMSNANFEYQQHGTGTPPFLFKSSSVGDAETRPRNIALYTYIKVHEQ
jgi:hypothetical protein